MPTRLQSHVPPAFAQVIKFHYNTYVGKFLRKIDTVQYGLSYIHSVREYKYKGKPSKKCTFVKSWLTYQVKPYPHMSQFLLNFFTPPSFFGLSHELLSPRLNLVLSEAMSKTQSPSSTPMFGIIRTTPLHWSTCRM